MSTHGCTHASACNECCCDVILMVHLRVLSSVLTMPAPSMVMPHSLCLSVCLFLSKDGIAARLFPRQSILFPADEPLAVLNKPCVTSLRQPRTSLLRQLSSVYPRNVSPFAIFSATLRGICTHACGCRLKRIFEEGEVHLTGPATAGWQASQHIPPLLWPPCLRIFLETASETRPCRALLWASTSSTSAPPNTIDRILSPVVACAGFARIRTYTGFRALESGNAQRRPVLVRRRAL